MVQLFSSDWYQERDSNPKFLLKNIIVINNDQLKLLELQEERVKSRKSSLQLFVILLKVEVQTILIGQFEGTPVKYTS